MNIEEVFPHVLGLIEADPLCSPVPRISELDLEFETKYEAALADKGMAFVLMGQDGVPVSGNTGDLLDLDNGVMLSVVERRKGNTTGAVALVWVRRLLRLLHRNRAGAAGRVVTRHPARGPAYSLGHRGQGLVIYFVHLEVRSIEPVGALPAP